MLVFFTFMTQMHERYACRPAVVILVLLVAEPRSRWLWVALSIVFVELLAAVPPTAQIGPPSSLGPLGIVGSLAMIAMTLVGWRLRRPAPAT